jgi:hypothetical protein
MFRLLHGTDDLAPGKELFQLELTCDELRRVRSHPAPDLAVGEPVTRTVRSIYFDTPDHRPRALGIRCAEIDGES